MNLLDENIPEHQRQLLRGWRIPVRQIGREVGRKGLSDEAIISLLHRLPRPTCHTRDEGVDALEIALRRPGEGYLHSRQEVVIGPLASRSASSVTRRSARAMLSGVVTRAQTASISAAGTYSPASSARMPSSI